MVVVEGEVEGSAGEVGAAVADGARVALVRFDGTLFLTPFPFRLRDGWSLRLAANTALRSRSPSK